MRAGETHADPTPKPAALATHPVRSGSVSARLMEQQQRGKTVPLPLVPAHAPDASITREAESCGRGEPLKTQPQALHFPQHCSCHTAADQKLWRIWPSMGPAL